MKKNKISVENFIKIIRINKLKTQKFLYYYYHLKKNMFYAFLFKNNKIK